MNKEYLSLLKKRILKYTEKSSDGCWTWTASYGSQGYGQLGVMGSPKGAHRVSYMVFNDLDELPSKVVCHSCDNKACVNPNHLFIGSNKDNVQDYISKFGHYLSNRTYCIHGHEFTEENTYVHKNKRACKECRRIRSKRYYREGRYK